MSDYQYGADDAHRAAGIAALFQVSSTTVLAELPPSEYGTPTFHVLVQGLEQSHGYWYPVSEEMIVTWKANGTAVISDPPEDH